MGYIIRDTLFTLKLCIYDSVIFRSIVSGYERQAQKCGLLLACNQRTIHIVVVIIEYLHVIANDIHKGAPSRDKGGYGKANKATGDKTTSLLPVIGMRFFMEIFERFSRMRILN